MTIIKIVGAAALSIVLAGPAFVQGPYDSYAKPSVAIMTCERKMRCISVALIFIRDTTRVGAACTAMATTPAPSMTTWVRRIWDVGELNIRLQ